MLRVYVASALTLKARAQRVAAALREAGIAVCSSWHAQSSATVEAERQLSDADRAEIADLCRAEVRSCDVLVIILGPPTDRHGSFAEAELAHECGKRIVAHRPYAASIERPAFLADAAESRTVAELLAAVAR